MNAALQEAAAPRRRSRLYTCCLGCVGLVALVVVVAGAVGGYLAYSLTSAEPLPAPPLTITEAEETDAALWARQARDRLEAGQPVARSFSEREMNVFARFVKEKDPQIATLYGSLQDDTLTLQISRRLEAEGEANGEYINIRFRGPLAYTPERCRIEAEELTVGGLDVAGFANARSDGQRRIENYFAEFVAEKAAAAGVIVEELRVEDDQLHLRLRPLGEE